MEVLDDILSKNRDPTSITLRYRGLDTLDDLLPRLCGLLQLQTLDLQGNHLSKLPPNLSSLGRLRSLNLRQNMFGRVSYVLPSLQTIPQLRSLAINLDPRCDDLQEVLQALPRLERLNGQWVSCAGTIPTAATSKGDGEDASRQGGWHAKAEGWEENRVLEPVIPEGTKERGKGVEGDLENPPDVEGVAERRLVVTQEDLESVATLFGRVKALWGPMSPRAEAEMGSALDSHVRGVLGNMRKRLPNASEGPAQDAEVVLVKHGLYDICFLEIINVTAQTSPRLSSALATLRLEHMKLLQMVPGIIQAATVNYAQEIKELMQAREDEAIEAAQLLEAAQALEKEAVSYHTEVTRLHRRLTELERENASIRRSRVPPASKAATAARTTAAPGSQESPRPEGSCRKNHRVSIICRRHPCTTAAGTTKEGLTSGGTDENVMPGTPPPSHEAGADPGVPHPRLFSPVRGMMRGALGALGALGRDENSIGAGGPGRSQGWGSSCGGDRGMGQREMTLKQLKDLIEQVYASKEAFDRRCTSQRAPTETMERFLGSFLLNRYGLRPLAEEHASQVLRSVSALGAVDNDARVFGKILTHQVDQRFHHVQRRLKETAVDLLRQRLRQQNPFKPESELASLLRRKTHPEAPIPDPDWEAIVEDMFSPGDATTLGLMVRETLAEGRKTSIVGATTGVSSGRVCEWRTRRMREDGGEGGEGGVGGVVRFGDFVQVLLDFQLFGHEACLAGFQRDFREVDADGDGVVSAAEFLELARRTIVHGQDPDNKNNMEQGGPWNGSKRCNNNERSRGIRNAAPGVEICSYDDGRKGRNIRPAREKWQDPLEEEEEEEEERAVGGVETEAEKRLQCADPYQHGKITFSECVAHLAWDIAAGLGTAEGGGKSRFEVVNGSSSNRRKNTK